MDSSHTLTIIKPDAFGAGLAGKIIAHLEDAEFRIAAARVVHLTPEQAGNFYSVHRKRPFYSSLVTFMTSGPCLALILSRQDAVSTLRRVIGATNPKEADPGTVRHLYAESVERNAIHASDSDLNAEREARFFFAEADVIRTG
jgi:nucleoside-diphosphate kinase